MSHTREYKILKGSHTGKVFAGISIGARFEPDGPADWDKTSNRVWIPELKTSFLSSAFDPNGKNEAEDLYVPYDRFNNKIAIGDMLYVAVKSGVVRARVIGLGKPHHHGCGWCERQLKLQDIDSQRKFSNNYPHDSIKVLTSPA